MAKEPPSFSCAEYWDKRFRTETQTFEWLLPETSLDEELENFKEHNNGTPNQILHIGPGTSMLSFHLKRLMGNKYSIHNVDFSHEAVEWGRSKESEQGQSGVTASEFAAMQWSQVSLLSLPSVLSTTSPGSVALVVDKSTSDAIACGLDARVRLSQVSTNNNNESAPEQDEMDHTKIHPLHVLALNLAIVAAPGARWLTLSYSKDRYPFLPMLFGPFPDPLPDGVPDPVRYWTLLRKQEIQTEQEVPEKFKKQFEFVHRPVTSHYIYVLERTAEVLEISEMERLDVQAEER
jgi:hypothetical protein